MTGVQNLLRRLDDASHRNLADNDVDLDLRKQRCLNRNTTVVLRSTLLRAAAEYVGDGHTCDAEIHHRVLQALQAGLLAHDLDLRELRRTVVERRNLVNRDSFRYRSVTRDNHGSRRCSFTCEGKQTVIDAADCRHEIRVCGRQTMLGAVQTADFLLRRNAETDGLLDDHEGDQHHHRRPCKDGDDTERLNAQQLETTGVEQTLQSCGSIRVCQQTDCDRTPDTVCKMNTYGTDRIVDVKLQIKELNDYNYQDTGYDTDDDGAESVQRVTACGDTDKAGQRAVQAHRNIRLTVLDPGVKHRHNSGNRRSDRRGNEDGR